MPVGEPYKKKEKQEEPAVEEEVEEFAEFKN